MGVCLDTCHVHDGYEIVENLDKVLVRLTQIVGLRKLKPCI